MEERFIPKDVICSTIYNCKTRGGKKKCLFRNPLAVQWLGLRAFTAEGLGSTPGRGTKIL